MKKTIAIVGGGPSSIFLASFLDSELYDITIYEKNKTLGRKFLVAGKGGFNLTHSEDIDSFISRYTPSGFIKDALLHFDNSHLVHFLDKIDIPTYVGSSKRVFPKKVIKPIEVLQALLDVIKNNGVSVTLEHQWLGWNEQGDLLFNTGKPVSVDITVFALGGGSWKVTGSDGKWIDRFENKGVKTVPFFAANCAFEVDWLLEFISKNEGKPLKNISISCQNKEQKGEVVITKFGLEGNAIYALSHEIQFTLSRNQKAEILIDLKPSFDFDKIIKILSSGNKRNLTERLKRDLKLSPTKISLIKNSLSKEEFLNLKILSNKIKALPIQIISAGPIDEAISTSGGISLEAMSTKYELKHLPNTYCIGEMLNWTAPTGGYLLQACISMGVYLASHLNSKNFQKD